MPLRLAETLPRDDVRRLLWIADTPLVTGEGRNPTDAEAAACCGAAIGCLPGVFNRLVLERWQGDEAETRESFTRAFAHLNAAFATFVPPAESESGEPRKARFGWPLELVEFLMAEYKMPFDAAMDLPLKTAFALQACAHARTGVP